MFYAALGHAQSRGASPYQFLDEALPAGDRFLAQLPAPWHHGNSPYWTGWSAIERAAAALAGDSIAAQLHLYQAVAAIAVLVSAWLVARALRDARAGALVAFCPLALVEGTLNAHNDALLMPSVALFALVASRALGLAALASGALVKATSLVLLGWASAEAALTPLRRWLTPRRVIWVASLFALAMLGAFLALRERVPYLNELGALVGRPSDASEHITRSVESLPRAFLRWVVHRPDLSWLVGLAFRAAGATWLIYAAARSVLDGKRIAWAAAALFGYYLYFHGFMQSWYLLPLVALLPFADPRLIPAMKVHMICSLAQYAVDLPLHCDYSLAAQGAKEVLEGAVVILPPSFVLWRNRHA
jgi:hypothetical protein